MEAVVDGDTRTCRLCMSDEDVVLYVIYENPGSRKFNMPLRSRIKVCLGINVLPYDNLPQFICHICLHKVDSYYKFREDCLQCDHFLKAKKNTVTLLLDGEVGQKHEKNPSESSDFEDYEDEPPVIMVNKHNCESVDDLTDPLALSDTESKLQQKEALDTHAGATPLSFLNAEVIDKVSLIDSSETSSLSRVTENSSQDAATHTKSKGSSKFIDVEDVIRKQRKAHQTQAKQAAKCTVCNVECTCIESEHHCIMHKTEEHLNKNFTCPVCSKSFSAKFSLKRHMFTHSYVKPFKCPNCDCAYSDKSNLIKHQRKRHSDVGLYTCCLCQTVFSSKPSLLKHRRTFHFVRKTNAVIHTDHDCYTKRERSSKNTRSRDSISKKINWLTDEDRKGHHEVIQHEEIDLKEELPEVCVDEDSKSQSGIGFPFVCNVCFLSFQSYIELYRHMTEHEQGNVCEM